MQKHEANVYDQLDVSGEPVIENRKPSLKIARNVMKSFTVLHPHTFEKCDKEFYSQDSLHGHVACVHTAAAHPQTCEKCNKKCYSKVSLHKREANVHDQ